MSAISRIKANMLQESHPVRLLQGLRNAASSFAKLLRAATVILYPHTLLAQHTPPTSEEVEAFVERAASEQYKGKGGRVPDRIFTELVKGVPAGNPYCHPDDRNMLQASQIILTPNLPGGLAIKGGGGCFCSPAGNCAFWIYQLKDGKYRAVLSRGSVQSFGFLKSRTHCYPDLVTWSHGSATMSEAKLYRFDGNRYVASGRWDVEFEYLGHDGQIVKPDEPRITSHFTSKDQLPKEVKP